MDVLTRGNVGRGMRGEGGRMRKVGEVGRRATTRERAGGGRRGRVAGLVRFFQREREIYVNPLYCP